MGIKNFFRIIWDVKGNHGDNFESSGLLGGKNKMDKKLARPDTYGMYCFGFGNSKCYIHCFPQQKWEYKINEKDKLVELSNEKKRISMQIELEDFETNWIVLGE